MAAVTAVRVLDAERGFRRFDQVSRAPDSISAQLALLQEQARGRNALGILGLALKEKFARKTAIVSSFGTESAALLHLIAEIDPTTPILFVNTGKLFGETLRYRDRLQDLLGLTDVRSLGPHPIARANKDPEGVLWSRDPDACCAFRKVQPLKQSLNGFSAVVTGRKRFQTRERSTMSAVEFFDGRFRFNPLCDWSLADVDAYFTEHNLPRHPLVDDGYVSIGCMPCTRRLQAGESYRDGRWAGLEKDECGIHTGIDGEGI